MRTSRSLNCMQGMLDWVRGVIGCGEQLDLAVSSTAVMAGQDNRSWMQGLCLSCHAV